MTSKTLWALRITAAFGLFVLLASMIYRIAALEENQRVILINEENITAILKELSVR